MAIKWRTAMYGGTVHYRFFNTGLVDQNNKSIDGRLMPMQEFIDYCKSNNATPFYFVGVCWKKGKW